MANFFHLCVVLAAIVAYAPVGSHQVYAARDSSRQSAKPPLGEDATNEIDSLIADLGHERYAVRRRAEEQLLQKGPEAFDQLKSALTNPDLEIAERVRYILERMRVEWTRPSDPPEIRRLLTRYAELPDSDKAERISQLARLPEGSGLPALCRIARFEPSALIARRAAVAVLGLKQKPSKIISAACRRELGDNFRPPVSWLHLYFKGSQDSRESLAAWDSAIDAEAALLREKSPDTRFDIIRRLMQRRLDECHRLQLRDETLAALTDIVELIDHQLSLHRKFGVRRDSVQTLSQLINWGVDFGEEDSQAAAIGWALEWLAKHQRWDLLDGFRSRYSEKLQSNRRTLYFLAGCIARSGDEKQAADLADAAFKLKGDDDERRVYIAAGVAELGFVDWAMREYRRVLSVFDVLEPQSLAARRELAMWLHDRQRFREAAGLLGQFCDAVAEDAKGKVRLVDALNRDRKDGRGIVLAMQAKREHYQACWHESRGEYDLARQRLEKAAQLYDDDPDVLIAMYRLPEVDEPYREKTRSLIRRMSNMHQQLIDQEPNEPSLYNQWAWLVANTEGDKDQAVAYSRRSLELKPDEPSYLDTLGRCYFAVGDLENALKCQRQAVKLAPQYQVMKRQLDEFERALAEAQGE